MGIRTRETKVNSDIISKLRVHLSNPVNTECAVVYLLAEIRKLLEKNGPHPELFALRMYCHWALHVDLTRWSTTKALLQSVDSYVRNNVVGFQDDESFAYNDENALFQEFVGLDTFRQELRTFLRACGLPSTLCDDDDSWRHFINQYAGVIEDGALSAEGSSDLKAVQRVVFKGRFQAHENDAWFVNHWKIELKDGRTLCVDANRTRYGGWLISGHLQRPRLRGR